MRSASDSIGHQLPSQQGSEHEHATLTPLGISGVQLGNTDPSKLHLVCAGLDWLKLVAFGTNVRLPVIEQLTGLRKQAAAGEEVYFSAGGQKWLVLPRGTGKGSNHFAFLLTQPGLTLALSTREKSPADGGSPVAYVEATGQMCAGRSPMDVHDDLVKLLKSVGIIAHRIIVGRADVQGDVAGLDIMRVVRAVNEEKVVGRPKRHEAIGFGRRMETLFFGSRENGAAGLRIYDKSRELSKNVLKEEMYKAAHGQDEVPGVLTRVEFTLSGGYLREQHDVKDSAEFMRRLGSIVTYMMTEWFRVCSSVDKNHTDRAKPVAWWKWLCSKMSAAMNGTEDRRRRPATVPIAERVLKQVRGGLSTLAALKGMAPANASDVVKMFAGFFDIDSRGFQEACELKVSKFVSVFRMQVAGAEAADG